MENQIESGSSATAPVRILWNVWRLLGWSLIAVLLALPALAMQFTNEVQWDAADFIVMGVLLGSTGLAADYVISRSPNVAYRLGSLLALLTAFLTVWVNLAVGMIGSEDNPYNLLFLCIPVAVLMGAIALRFSASGLACTFAVAAIAQGTVSLAAAGTDPRGAIFSFLFAAGWALAAALCWNASRQKG